MSLIYILQAVWFLIFGIFGVVEVPRSNIILAVYAIVLGVLMLVLGPGVR